MVTGDNSYLDSSVTDASNTVSQLNSQISSGNLSSSSVGILSGVRDKLQQKIDSILSGFNVTPDEAAADLENQTREAKKAILENNYNRTLLNTTLIVSLLVSGVLILYILSRKTKQTATHEN